MQLASPIPRGALPEVVSSILMLCRGTSAQGGAYWAYVCMLPSQAELFYHARGRGALSLDDYGTVLEWGDGEQPPASVKQRMRDQFGARDDFEDMLITLIEQQGGKR